MTNPLESVVQKEMSRRGFLKLAAGTVMGAALLSLPDISKAGAAAKAGRSIKPRVCKIFCVNAKASCSKLIYNPY